MEISNWLNKKITPPDLPTGDLFVSKDAEQLFMDCGIKHDIFSSFGKFLGKKGFVYGMMDAFTKRYLIKIKANSRTSVQIFFKNSLEITYSDPRSRQKGALSITFRDGYNAAIRYIEDNYQNS